MKDVLRDACELCRKNTPSVLAIIVRKHGSSPRGVGAAMLVTREGLVSGTIGGGAIEAEAIAMAKKLIGTRDVIRHRFVLNEQNAMSIGMVCGGENEVAFFPIAQEDGEHLGTLMKEKTLGLPMDGGAFFAAEKREGFSSSEEVFYWRPHRGMRLVIFGGGHVAQALARIGETIAEEILVYEDREEFLNEEDFPKNTTRILGSFDEISHHYAPGPEDFVCVITRGHSADSKVVEAVLPHEVAYLGVIGSKRKVALLKKNLVERGFSEERCNFLHAPIGLSIGAETPEEIAISIAAELILVKNDKEDR